MQFRTEIPVATSDFQIDYQSDLLLLGSCFAENIGRKLDYYKFKNKVNPFGIVFNAVSLEKLVDRSVHQKHFTEEDVFHHNDLWHCFEVHSELSHPNKEIFLNTLNQLLDSTHAYIARISHCLITLGTSWVYRFKESNEIVANCHKVPQKSFTKELLSVAQNVTSLQNIVSLIQSINPKVKFVFTVSPVRHIKDGFFENNVSKSHLFAALYQAFDFKNPTFDYFPSYEIVMDELRDYRFYDRDLLHPNAVAIDYIWECFSKMYFNESTLLTLKEIETVQKGLHHKSFTPESEAHQKFLSNLQEKINTLVNKLPHISF